jgi:predicted nucleotidyltransferase
VRISQLEDSVRLLQEKLSCEWPVINKARLEARGNLSRIRDLLDGLDSTDASIVAFGSLARAEWTAKSDVDWTLLVDGQADPQHLEVSQAIAGRLKKEGFAEPGPTGVFGNMAFSHDIVHKIGGEDDTNKNTTQRILLLLESVSVGKRLAYERVMGMLVSRYLDDDRGLRFGSQPYRVPRFLLNDIVRYWRTVAVDFVEKQRGRAGQGWGLRNAKLRMSRKLTFVAGLLTCFSCEMFTTPQARNALTKEEHPTSLMASHLLDFTSATPLDILCFFLLNSDVKPRTSKMILDAYDSFLSVLADSEKRTRLERLTPEDIADDLVFNEVREISRKFQTALTAIFFHDDDRLRRLIEFYGVF